MATQMPEMKQSLSSSISQAESSLARALEAEDKLRFGTGTNVINPKEAKPLERKEVILKNERKEKAKMTKEQRKEHKSHKPRPTDKEKSRKNDRPNKPERQKKKVVRRCHSDTELDSVVRDAKNRIARRTLLLDKKVTRSERNGKINVSDLKSMLVIDEQHAGIANNVTSHTHKPIVRNGRRSAGDKQEEKAFDGNMKEFETIGSKEMNTGSYANGRKSRGETSKICVPSNEGRDHYDGVCQMSKHHRERNVQGVEVSRLANDCQHLNTRKTEVIAKYDADASRHKNEPIRDDCLRVGMHTEVSELGMRDLQAKRNTHEASNLNMGSQNVGKYAGELSKYSTDANKHIKDATNIDAMTCQNASTNLDAYNIRDFEGHDNNQSKMLNLLLVYFKELTKEICEFREEKKKMREQLCKLETNQEKLTNFFETQKLEIKRLSDRVSKRELKEMSEASRPDFKREVRNLLEDVHRKYHEQLIEHEMRMKCVQERAEHDIRHLMRNIVDNYVEISQLKGRNKDIDSLIGKHRVGIASRMHCMPSGDIEAETCVENKSSIIKDPCVKPEPSMPNNLSVDLSSESRNEELKLFDKSEDEISRNKRHAAIKLSASQEKPTRKYEYYFPRNESKNSESISQTLNTRQNNLGENYTKDLRNKWLHIESVNEHGNESLPENPLRDSVSDSKRCDVSVDSPDHGTKSPPKKTPHKAGAYLEWRQFLRDKLTQRTSIENNVMNMSNEDQRNIT